MRELKKNVQFYTQSMHVGTKQEGILVARTRELLRLHFEEGLLEIAGVFITFIRKQNNKTRQLWEKKKKKPSSQGCVADLCS